MNVLVDANVLLDVLLNRPPWVGDSGAVWNAVHNGTIRGSVVATAVTTLFYIARKVVGEPLALAGVSRCLATFDVLAVDQSILRSAAALPSKDFEDNVVIQCAVVAGVGAIVTRDLSGFVHSPISVLTPGQLIARLPQVAP